MIVIENTLNLGDALRPVTETANGLASLISGKESLVAKQEAQALSRLQALKEELNEAQTAYEIAAGNTMLLKILNDGLLKNLANTSVRVVRMEGSYSTVLTELKHKMQTENEPFNGNDDVFGVLFICNNLSGKLALQTLTGLTGS